MSVRKKQQLEYIRRIATNGSLLSKYLRQKKARKREEQGEEPSLKDRPLQSMCHRLKKCLILRNPTNVWTKLD